MFSQLNKVEGLIVKTLPNQLFIVELSNGHRLTAHVAYRQKPLAEKLGIGAMVLVKLSLSDLSRGRLILNDN